MTRNESIKEERTNPEKRGRGRPRKVVAVLKSKPKPEKRGGPTARRNGNRCICGRNLDYPLKVTEKAIICRCGRRHQR